MPKKVPPAPHRLTPAQFKALAKYKGWTYRAMAARWGIQPESLSAIARDPERSTRYDDMLHGLPNLNRVGRDLQRMAKQVAFALAKMEGRKPPEEAKPKTLPPGYRYHDYLTVGAVLVATGDVGSMAEEGMRGVVFNVQDDGVQERYGVIFETGMWDWFPPEYVDIYLATTGLDSVGTVNYRYASEDVLQQDFHAGVFQFWPPTPDE